MGGRYGQGAKDGHALHTRRDCPGGDCVWLEGMMDEIRKAFDAWRSGMSPAEYMAISAEAIWQAATMAERERCCHLINQAGINGNDMPHTVIEKYLSAIRNGGDDGRG